MSAKSRGSVVIGQEFYPTPEYTVESILNEIDFKKVHSFREPCRGGGVIYDSIPSFIDIERGMGLSPHTREITKDYCELSEGIDYLKTELGSVDLIVTNPPFSLAQEFIEKAIGESDTVIMLQRVNYLGSKTRKPFWDKYPPTHLFVLSSRPKFISKCQKCKNPESYQNGTIEECPLCGGKVRPQSDATEYAWFVWDKKNIVKKPAGIYVV